MWIDTDGTVYLYYTGPDNKFVPYITRMVYYSIIYTISEFSLICWNRETRVNLHCDMMQKDPLVMTYGDSDVHHSYVRSKMCMTGIM